MPILDDPRAEALRSLLLHLGWPPQPGLLGGGLTENGIAIFLDGSHPVELPDEWEGYQVDFWMFGPPEPEAT